MEQDTDQMELGDFDLSIPDLTSSVASDGLSMLVQSKRSTEQQIIDVLNSLKIDLLKLREELTNERATSENLKKIIRDLHIQNEVHVQKNRSLFHGYNALLRVIDNSDTAISIEQKLEAMLLSSDAAVYLNVDPDITTTKARAFLKSINN